MNGTDRKCAAAGCARYISTATRDQIQRLWFTMVRLAKEK